MEMFSKNHYIFMMSPVGGNDLLTATTNHHGFIKEFKQFAMQGNLVDIAVAFVMAEHSVSGNLLLQKASYHPDCLLVRRSLEKNVH